MKTKPFPTPIDALRIAVDFAQMDLDRVGAYISLLTEAVVQFLGAEVSSVPGQHGLWLSPADLKRIQPDVRRVLRSIVEKTVTRVDLAMNVVIIASPDRAARLSDRRQRLPDARVHTVWRGAPRDMFLSRLIRLLEHCDVETLRVCPAPECGRMFVKVTRKEFCSTQCQSRVYMRKYRALAASPNKKERHGKTTRTRRR